VTPIPEALRLAGVDPAEVSHVVLTHFHYDHIGNLDLFPASQVIVGATEFAFWTGDIAEQPIFCTAVEADEVDLVRKAMADARLTLVPDEDPRIPGVTFREVAGHTPGQIVVEVQTAGRPVLLASDSSHMYEEFEKERPFHIASSLPDMYSGLKWLKMRSSDTEVIPGHDPAVMSRFPVEKGIIARIA
jgi:glyoxylase-like metal-dependent hydrolase (beta-lactamase superfamily II)